MQAYDPGLDDEWEHRQLNDEAFEKAGQQLFDLILMDLELLSNTTK